MNRDKTDKDKRREKWEKKKGNKQGKKNPIKKPNSYDDEQTEKKS